MIPDGHNEHAIIDGYEFVYRRIPYDDAMALHRELIDAQTDELHDMMLGAIVAEQIVCAVPDEYVMPPEVFHELRKMIFGVGRYHEEKANEKNLHDGVYLATRWPWLAKTTCEQCRTWWYDPLTGRTSRPDRFGPPIKRPKGVQTLCECGVCPKGHWSSPVQLSEQNAAAFRFHQACEATGTFPHDMRVRRNGHIIASAVKSARSDQESDGAATRRSGDGPQHGHVPDRAGAGRRIGATA